MFDIKVAVTYYIQELFIKKKSKYIVSFMLTCNQGLQILYKTQVHLDYLTCTVTFYRQFNSIEIQVEYGIFLKKRF